MKKVIYVIIFLASSLGCKDFFNLDSSKLNDDKIEGRKQVPDTFPIVVRHQQLKSSDLSEKEIITIVDNFTFDNDTLESDYEPFSGDVVKMDVDLFYYDSKSIRLINVPKKYYPIFRKGVLHPSLLECTKCLVNNWENLDVSSIDDKFRIKFEIQNEIKGKSTTYLAKFKKVDSTSHLALDKELSNLKLIFLVPVDKSKYEEATSILKRNQ